MNLTDDWIIGFFEGEGSFHSARGRAGGKRYPRFTVTQKEYDMLARIKDHFGFGSISHMDQPTGRVWHWVVCNKHDLKIVIAFLDGRLRSRKKRKEYERWKYMFGSYFNGSREYIRRERRQR